MVLIEELEGARNQLQSKIAELKVLKRIMLEMQSSFSTSKLFS